MAGASLKIVEGEKADGKVVYEWTSEGKAKVFGLKSGVYTMVEDQAPLGFEKAEAITFRVSFDKNGGKVEVKQGDKFVAAKDAKVVMEDKPSLTPEKPKLSKTGLEIGALGIVSLVLIAAGSVIIRRKKTL
nr:prealbumin-like fold domain-containing protein [Arcanobacterium phocae]